MGRVLLPRAPWHITGQELLGFLPAGEQGIRAAMNERSSPKPQPFTRSQEPLPSDFGPRRALGLK